MRRGQLRTLVVWSLTFSLSFRACGFVVDDPRRRTIHRMHALIRQPLV